MQRIAFISEHASPLAPPGGMDMRESDNAAGLVQ